MPVEENVLHYTCHECNVLPDLNEIQTDVVVVDTKVVQFELNHSGINSRMLCYDDNSTCTSAPSLVKFIDDDSSADSLSSTGNASYLSALETFQTEVDQPRYNYHGPNIVLPMNESPVTICTADTINMVKS